MRLILLSIVGLLCLAYAFALNDNGANLEDLAHHGENHAEGGVRIARGHGGGGYGGHYGGHGHYGGGGGHGHHGGHYGR